MIWYQDQIMHKYSAGKTFSMFSIVAEKFNVIILVVLLYTNKQAID